MRRSPFALLFLASACSHVQPMHVEAFQPEGGCDKVPVPVEARYDDGKVMMRGTPLAGEDGAQWEYFDEDGSRAVLVKNLSDLDVSFTVYYPNGEKRIEAVYRKSEEEATFDVQTTSSETLELTTRYNTVSTTAHKVMVQRPHGTWTLNYEDGKPLARAVFNNGELLDREQWDESGSSVEWSLPDRVFHFRQPRMLVAAKPVYPPDPERLGIEGRTCSLVCLDREGELQGLFSLTRAPKEFETAARTAIRRSSYAPEKIGEVALPACMAMQTLFKVPTGGSAPRRMLALGDSYTIGESVAEEDRWPAQLVAALRKDGVDLPDPEIIAQTKWTTDELLAKIDRARLRGPYGLVTVQIGVNDQVRGVPAESYRRELRKLLGTAVELAGGRASRVIVLSLPDWGATPFGEGRDRDRIAEEIDTFNRVASEEAKNAGALWVDVTDLSREARHDPTLIADDGLHPSAKMYAAWVARVRATAAMTVAHK
jgi:lysophospholipase L1-like esterase